MLILNNYNIKIRDFVIESVRKFEAAHGTPKSIGIYCCPWSSWLTINFNLNKSLEETNNNCPDFEFAEFDVIDFPEWQDEYETDKPIYQTANVIIQFNHDEGNEGINKIFFTYLLSLMTEINSNLNQKILLQFLDSNCIKLLKGE